MKIQIQKFIDSHEVKSFTDDEYRHDRHDSEIVRSLAKKFERLYGSGNCQFIEKDCAQRYSDHIFSANISPERVHNFELKSVGSVKSLTNSFGKNESKSQIIDENMNSDKKAIETLKAIRELCNKTLNFYSIKHYLSANSSTKAKNIKTNTECLSHQLSGKVDGVHDEHALHSGLKSTPINSVVYSQTDSLKQSAEIMVRSHQTDESALQ